MNDSPTSWYATASCFERVLPKPPTSWTCRRFLIKVFFQPDGICQRKKYRGGGKSCWNCRVTCEEALRPQNEVCSITYPHNWPFPPRDRLHWCLLWHFQFMNQLDGPKPTLSYFQQDGAACHASNRPSGDIRNISGDRIIPKWLWLPLFQEVTPLDFFLRKLLRGSKNKPSTAEDPKRNIINAMTAVPLSRCHGCNIREQEVSGLSVYLEGVSLSSIT